MPQCLGHGRGIVRPAVFYVPPSSSVASAVAVPQDAAVDFQGVAQSSFTAEKILEASESYQGVGQLVATAQKVLEATESYQGVGLIGATAQKLLEAAGAYQGVGQIVATAEKVLEAGLSLQAIGLIASFGSIIYTAVVNFVVAAVATFAGIKPWEHEDGTDTSYTDISESDPLIVTPLPKSVVMMISQDGTEIVATELPASIVPVTQVTGQSSPHVEVGSTRPTFTDVA